MQCGNQFDARSHAESDHIYCSVACGNRARRLTPPSRPCQRCGTVFALDPKNNGQIYCSRSCAGQAIGDTLRKPKALASRIHIIDCAQCNKPFVARVGHKKLCSKKCRDERQAQRYYNNPKYRDGVIASGHARRADKLGLGNHRITLTYLIERDGGRCQIPSCQYRRRTVAPVGVSKRNPRGPSIDHIIPLSQGGTHTLDNVQLAHLKCNRVKHNTGSGDQLRLIG